MTVRKLCRWCVVTECHPNTCSCFLLQLLSLLTHTHGNQAEGPTHLQGMCGCSFCACHKGRRLANPLVLLAAATDNFVDPIGSAELCLLCITTVDAVGKPGSVAHRPTALLGFRLARMDRTLLFALQYERCMTTTSRLLLEYLTSKYDLANTTKRLTNSSRTNNQPFEVQDHT